MAAEAEALEPTTIETIEAEQETHPQMEGPEHQQAMMKIPPEEDNFLLYSSFFNAFEVGGVVDPQTPHLALPEPLNEGPIQIQQSK